MSTYPFRREDNDEIIQLDFETTMTADVAGFVTLPDGVVARRVREGSFKRKSADRGAGGPVLSDTLGFAESALPKFQEHLRQSGVRGVEFVRDKEVPGFIQVKCDNQAAKMRYARSRGLDDMNSKNGSGAMLGEHHLEKVRKLLERKGVA